MSAGEISVWINIIRGTVRWGNVRLGNYPLRGECLWGTVRRENVRRRKVRRGNVRRGTVWIPLKSYCFYSLSVCFNLSIAPNSQERGFYSPPRHRASVLRT